MGKKTQELKEKFLTISIFTGIFLPTRLFFYTYVSQVWIGSFGLMTTILIVMLILARKNKLGYVGYLVNKHSVSFSKGKFGKFAMGYLIFSIYFLGMIIYGIENPPPIKQMVTDQLAAEGITDMESATTGSQNIVWTGPGAVLGPLFSIIIILIPNPIGYAIYGVINDFTHGWLLHFATVFAIEQLEILGLVIYFRYIYKPKKDINTC